MEGKMLVIIIGGGAWEWGSPLNQALWQEAQEKTKSFIITLIIGWSYFSTWASGGARLPLTLMTHETNTNRALALSGIYVHKLLYYPWAHRQKGAEKRATFPGISFSYLFHFIASVAKGLETCKKAAFVTPILVLSIWDCIPIQINDDYIYQSCRPSLIHVHQIIIMYCKLVNN